MNEHVKFLTILLVSVLQLILCLLFIYNDFFYLLYVIAYELTLILLLAYSSKNSIFFTLSFSFLFYFYQVPFLEFFPYRDNSVYNITYIKHVADEVYILYSFIVSIFCLFIAISTNLIKTDPLTYIKPRLAKLSAYGFNISLVLCVLMIIYSIYNAGGFESLSTMNKFESYKNSKLLFFTYQEFFILLCAFYFSQNKKSLIQLIAILLLILFELFLTRRFLILVFGVLLILFNKDKIDFKRFLLIVIGVFIANLSKLFYYSLPYAIMNDVPDFWGTVFYFEWDYFFRNIYHMGEFSAHIRLTYLSIQNNLGVGFNDFLQLILATIPFSNTILDVNFVSIGDKLRISLSEDWAGLASSTYILPYLALGYTGVVLIYTIYFTVLLTLMYLTRYSVILMILLIYIAPTSLFYFHREPIIVIFKSITIGLTITCLVYMLIILIKSLARLLKSGKTL